MLTSHSNGKLNFLLNYYQIKIMYEYIKFYFTFLLRLVFILLIIEHYSQPHHKTVLRHKAWYINTFPAVLR